jgi:anti-sigma factor RsiW
MRCPIETQESAELLLAYCARRLDLETMAVLDRHMASCPACQGFQKGQQAVWQALDAWETMPVSADFDRRLYQRIDAESSSSWWSRFTRPLGPMFAGGLLSRGVPVAAAACLLVIAGVILERPNQVVVPDSSDARVEAIQADQVERALDDLDLLRQFKLVASTDGGNRKSM